MSVLTDIIDRSRTGNKRKEDEVIIYHKPSHAPQVIHKDSYNGYTYGIYTNGFYPMLVINPEGVRCISVFSGMSVVTLPDHAGDNKKLDRSSFNEFIYDYDKQTDFTTDFYGHNGKKHTVTDIIADAKAFIDEMVKREDEFVKKI